MAKIMYQNENNLLLQPREAFSRSFDFGQWTEIRMGMLFRLVGTASDSASVVHERISVNSYSDRVYIGLKSSGSNFPGIGGTNFIGIGTVSGSGAITSSNIPAGNFSLAETSLLTPDSYARVNVTAISGSSTYQNRQTLVGNANAYFSSSASGSDYNAFYGLKFVLENSGSSSQRFDIKYKFVVNGGTGSSDIHTRLYDGTDWLSIYHSWLGSATASWTTGIPLPDSFFVYSPLYNNRLRISAIEVLKIS